MAHPPPDTVLKAFEVSQSPYLLSGGEGRCWRAGKLIFKPCEKAEPWQWLAEHLPTVKTDGFRLPLPVCARNGQWVVDGWCAQKAVEGDHPTRGRWAEIILAVDFSSMIRFGISFVNRWGFRIHN